MEDLTKIFENIRPSIEYFGEIKNNLIIKGVKGLASGELKQNLKKLKDETVKNRDKINEILDESVSLLKTMNKEMYNNKNKTINNTINELVKTKQNIQSTINVISGKTFKDVKWYNVLSVISDVKKFIETIFSMRDVDKNYKANIENVVGEFGTKMVKDATDIIFAPETIPNFDMLLGLNIVKSEHDAVKYDYETKMLKILDDSKYAVHNGGVGQGLNINLRYDNKVKPIYLNTNIDMLHYSNVNNHMNRVVLSNELGYTPNKFDFVAKTDLTYKDIMLNDLAYSKLNNVLAYSKLNADVDLSLKFKLRSRNSKWLLRPGIEYVGNYEYVNTKNSVVSVEIFERDKNGNLIDNDGNSVDISKESRYKDKYKKDLKEVFKHKSVTYSKKWLKPTHTIIPSVDIIYMPTKNIDISYGVIVPVKFIGKNFDGIMIKNKVGLGIKF